MTNGGIGDFSVILDRNENPDERYLFSCFRVTAANPKSRASRHHACAGSIPIIRSIASPANQRQ